MPRAGPSPALDVDQLRADTGAVGHLTYFNNARQSPPPRPALDAVHACLTREFRKGWAGLERETVIPQTRSALAALIGADPSEVAITRSATHGFNLVVNGLDWNRGDNVIVTDLAFTAIMCVLLRACDTYGLELRVVKSHALLLDPDDVRAAIDARTRLVVVDHVPTFCGVAQPLRDIGAIVEPTHALFVVNATQSIGQLPIDVGEVRCDVLFGTSRKWLRGPRGLGVLFIRRDMVPVLRPDGIGYPAAQWTEPGVYRLAETIDRFEGGDYPHALVAGLRASAEYAVGVGLHAIAQRNGELGRYARSALRSAGATVLDAAHGSTGTVPFRLPHMAPDAVVRRLASRGVETCVISQDSNRSGLRGLGTPDLVRLSLHYFNTTTEIDEAVALLGERTA